MKIRVGHSPDADDAFMFYALRKKKIPLGDFEIEHVIEDIETLNQRAFRSELEVTALSCHAYALVADRYGLLPYGASIGEGYGPIVVARQPVIASPDTSRGFAALADVSSAAKPRGAKQSDGIASAPPKSAADPRNDELRGKRIAIPGRTTTAYLTLQLYEKDFEPVFTPFDRIFRVLEKGKADLGLLIHEGQLTYAEKGFRKVLDLGEWWKKTHGLPLPLGINAIRRDLDEATISDFTSLFRKSLDYAMTHREEAIEYALQFGRGIDRKRGDQFVAMYVNDYSLDLGEKGKAALQLLFDLGWKKSLLPRPVRLEGFVATP